MGLSQSREAFRPFILETAAGETYIKEIPPKIIKPYSITRLDAKEGNKALATADTIDGFQETLFLDPVNTKAREGQGYSAMNGPLLPTTLTGLHTCIRVVWMNHSAEAGMPHTRAPDIVCIPMDYPAERLSATLVHESVHVDQRQRPEAWLKWCVENGWTLVHEDDIPERWRRRCRLNPDTMAYRFFAYQTRWIPLPLYEREDKPRMRDVHIYWWDRKTGELLKNPPVEMREALEGASSPEHPFEIAAYKDIHVE